jgi:hypothetical protein
MSKAIPTTLAEFREAVNACSAYSNIGDAEIDQKLANFLITEYMDLLDNQELPDMKTVDIQGNTLKTEFTDFSIQSLSFVLATNNPYTIAVNNFYSYNTFFKNTIANVQTLETGFIQSVWWYANGIAYYPVPVADTTLTLLGKFSICSWTDDMSDAIYNSIPVYARWMCVYGVAERIAREQMSSQEKIVRLAELKSREASNIKKGTKAQASYGITRFSTFGG